MCRQRARRVRSALLLFVYTVHVVGGCGPVTEVRPPPLSPPGGEAPGEEEPLPLPTDSVLATEVGAEGYTAGLLAGALQVGVDGEARYTLPLWVPPGRAGMQPELALGYDSRAGNGLLGVGWSLSGLSRLSRCGRTRAVDGYTAPIKFDKTDALCLDGQRLVLLTGTHGEVGAQYRTEVDTFARVAVLEVDGAGPRVLEVRQADGPILLYGSTEESQVAGPRARLRTQPPVGVAVARGPVVRLAWALSEVRDRSGNYIRIRYGRTVDEADGDAVEQWPEALEYTGSTTMAEGAQPRRRVVLRYEARPDVWSGYVAGLKLRTTKRLKRVELWAPDVPTAAGPAEPRVWRRYELSYRTHSLSGRSLLAEVRECDGQRVCRKPLRFEWALGHMLYRPGSAMYDNVDTGVTDVAANGYIPRRQGTVDTSARDYWTLQVADVNGDGRDDLLYRFSEYSTPTLLPPRWRLRLSTGLGFGPPVELSALPTAQQGDALEDLVMVDLDRDGRSEVLALQRADTQVHTHGAWRLFRYTGEDLRPVGGVEDDIYDSYYDSIKDVVPPVMHVGDVDGDGLPDLVRAWKGSVSDAASPTQWAVRRNTLAETGRLSFAQYLPLGLRTSADMAGYVADVDAEGTAEVLLRKPDPLPYAESRSPDGYAGYYSAVGLAPDNTLREVSTTLSALPWDYEYATAPFHPRQTWLADVNGDGLVDVLSLLKERQTRSMTPERMLHLALNTGAGFLPPEPLPLPPGALPSPAQLAGGRYVDNGVRLVDYNLDGRTDLLLMDAYSDRGVQRSHLTVLESTGTGFVPRTLPIPVGLSTGDGGTADRDSQPGSGYGWRLSRVLDVDGNGLQDIAQVNPATGSLHVYRREGGRPDLLVAVVDGNDNRTQVRYAALTDFRHGLYTPGTCSYPQHCEGRGRVVVTSLEVPDGIGGRLLYTHSYGGGRTDLLGRGWLGFAYRAVRDSQTQALEETWYDNTTRLGTHYPWAGAPTEERTTLYVQPGSSHTHTRQTRWHREWRTAGEGKTHFSCTTAQEVTEEDRRWGPLRHVQVGRECDTYGQTTQEETRVGRVPGDPQAHRLVRRTVYDHWPETWLLGLPRRQEQTWTTPPDERHPTGQSTTRTVALQYCPAPTCPDSHQPWRITLEPDAPGEDTWLQTTYTRSTTGQVTRVESVDRRGHTTSETVEWDAQEHLYPSAEVDALGHRTALAWHPALGEPLLVEDANGVRHSWRYDGLARLRLQSGASRADGLAAPEQAETTLSYGEEKGRLALSVRQQGGEEAVVLHDTLEREVARRTRAFDGSWSWQEVQYDSLGRVARTSLPHTLEQAPTWQEFRYDGLSRVTEELLPGTALLTYGHEGLRLRERNGTSERVLLLNALGQVLESQEYKRSGDTSSAITTRYLYAPFGLTEAVVDAAGNSTLALYDKRGRRVQHQTPDTGITLSTWSGLGDLLEERNAAGELSTFEYDRLRRLTVLRNPDGVTRFEWDTAAHGKGLLARAIQEGDPSTPADDVATSYGYDSLGRSAWEILAVNGGFYPVETGYDAHGRLERLQYPPVPGQPRFTLRQGYSASGALASVANEATGKVYWQALEEDAAGRLVRELYGNEVQTVRQFDSLGHLRSLEAQGPRGPVQALAYDYFFNGLMRSREDRLGGVAETFEYDALNRLTRWRVRAPGEESEVGYAYSDVGHLTERTERLGVGGVLQRHVYRHGQGAGPHALTSYNGETFRYDTKGNQTGWQGTAGQWREVQYTALNLPRTVRGPGLELDYRYDAHQQRVLRRSADGSETVYVGGLYERRQAQGTPSHVFHVQARGRTVAQVQWTEGAQGVAESVAWLHEDALGSVEAITDSTGAVVERRKYQPYGQRAWPDNPARPAEARLSSVHQAFTGHEEEEAAGLLLTPGRAYDLRTSHFLSADPYVADPLKSQAYHRYAYALNSPLHWTDPSGLTAVSICRTAQGEPCDGGPSLDLGPALEGAWGVAGQALGAVAQWVAQETRRAAHGSSGTPQPLASLADVNGPRRADLEFTLGVTLATTEYVVGTTTGMLQQVLDPTGAAVDQALGLLEGAWQGYEENGLLGAVNAGNPVYALLVHQYQAQQAAEEGEHVTAGYQGAMAALTAGSLLAMVVGGRGAAGRGARPWHFHGGRPSLLANLELVQSIATRAERYVGGKGRIPGIKKHLYAKRLLRRYQHIYGDRGLRPEISWYRRSNKRYGYSGSVRLDVLDKRHRVIYEYKFTSAPPSLRPSQILRMFNHGPRRLSMIFEINP
jgi:RHS repeat-associated protein